MVCAKQTCSLPVFPPGVIISLSFAKLKLKCRSPRLSSLDEKWQNLTLYVNCTVHRVLASGDSSYLCLGVSHQNGEAGGEHGAISSAIGVRFQSQGLRQRSRIGKLLGCKHGHPGH